MLYPHGGRRLPFFAIVAILSLSFLFLCLARRASADAIPGITSLQDLINRGPQQQSGVQLGNLVYYNFTYAGVPVGSAPTPSQILASKARTFGGLSFAYSWNSTSGNNQSSLISYSVAAVPDFVIYNAALDFQSTVAAANPADNASVTETFADSNGNVPLAAANWFNPNGTVNGVVPEQHGVSFDTPVAGLRVTDGIVVHTAPGSTGNSAISYVDNVFFEGQVAPAPEPGLMIVPLAAGLMLRRRRSSPCM